MDSLTVIIPGTALGKDRPRFGRGGASRPHSTAKTVNAEDHLRAHVIQKLGQPCLEGALKLMVDVWLPVPKSWPAERRARALEGLERPTGKPDGDNLLKLVCDALNGVLWRDDAQIVELAIAKFFSCEPRTQLSVWQL